MEFILNSHIEWLSKPNTDHGNHYITSSPSQAMEIYQTYQRYWGLPTSYLRDIWLMREYNRLTVKHIADFWSVKQPAISYIMRYFRRILERSELCRKLEIWIYDNVEKLSESTIYRLYEVIRGFPTGTNLYSHNTSKIPYLRQIRVITIHNTRNLKLNQGSLTCFSSPPLLTICLKKKRSQ